MSVPTEIGAQMLRFLLGRHFWTLTFQIHLNKLMSKEKNDRIGYEIRCFYKLFP